MSATVTYKGSTLTTVNNETKVLNTAGTWVEGDISITDSGGGSAAIIVDTTDSHGGTIRNITTTEEVHLQSNKTVTPSASVQTVLPDTGYDGLAQVSVGAIPSSYIIPSGTYSISQNGTYNVEAFARAEVLVQGGGGFSVDDIAMRTISGEISGSASVIEQYAFRGFMNLTSANFPLCSTIRNNAFDFCYELESVSFPACTLIGVEAFQSCSSLSSVYFPSCTSISPNAFNMCVKLTSVSFPVCTVISSYAFSNCKSLTSIYFPSCISIGAYAFQYCSSGSMDVVSFPACQDIGSGAFSDCRKITTAVFPSCTTIYGYAFYNDHLLADISFPECINIYSGAFAGCTSLGSVYFPHCQRIYNNAFANTGLYKPGVIYARFPEAYLIGSYAFASHSKLRTVILSHSSSSGTIYPYAFSVSSRITPPTTSIFLLAYYKLSNVNAFSGYTRPYLRLYVPSSLYDNYISATNWATYSTYFVSLTDDQVQKLIDYGTYP